MVRWLGALLVVIAGMVYFTATAPADDGPVFVSPDFPAPSATAARISGQLRPGDGIVVHVVRGEDPSIPANTIVITHVIGLGVTVVSGDGWMSQVTAEDLLQRVRNVTVDPIDEVVMLIRSIHAWQDKNPRPVPSGPPPPPPNYSWLWWAAGGLGIAILVWLIAWRIRVKARIEADLAQRADDPKYWEKVLKDLNNKVGE
jgi:hypothetical protein